MKAQYRFAILISDITEYPTIILQTSSGVKYKSKTIKEIGLDQLIDICDRLNEIIEQLPSE